ncbi:hypothetical protein J6590_097179 [Homalodisca vitripennis]|nr:hypothetical protein J6590_097179 [Homalodisca vitripennis]
MNANLDTAPLNCVIFQLKKNLSCLSQLHITKGCGPDWVPTNELKHCSEVLAPILSENKGVQSDYLNPAYVIRIYKSGLKDYVRNYRSIVAKLQKIMLLRIMPFLYPVSVRHSMAFFQENLLQQTLYAMKLSVMKV